MAGLAGWLRRVGRAAASAALAEEPIARSTVLRGARLLVRLLPTHCKQEIIGGE